MKKVTITYLDGEVEVYRCKKIANVGGFLVIFAEDEIISIPERLIKKITEE